MTRLVFALAAVLALSTAASAQQGSHSLAPRNPQNGVGMPIPAWNVLSHLEEIPTLPIIQGVVTSSISSLRSPCLIVVRHGKKYSYIDSVGVLEAHPKPRLRERDLEKFSASGGAVRILPPHYTPSDLDSAETACRP